MNEERMKSCVHTIIDCAVAIRDELERDNPFPLYIKEKLGPIENDLNCLKAEVENEL